VTSATALRFARAAIAALAGVASMVGSVELAGAQTQLNACELLTEKVARKVLGKPVRRETNLAGGRASSCSYTGAKDAKRVVGLAVGEFASSDEAWNAYFRGRADDKFDGLAIEEVRRIGYRAHWIPKTNNLARTIDGKKLAIGELTVLNDRFVNTVYLAPPSKAKARTAVERVIAAEQH
jgi:hypothetical protein